MTGRRISEKYDRRYCVRKYYPRYRCPFILPHSLMRNPHTLIDQILRKDRIGAMRIQPNKDKNPTKPERASVPGINGTNSILKKKGSVTIEAAFGIPLFLFAAVCLIWLLEIQSIKISMASAAQSAAKQAAEETAVIPVLNTVKLKSDIISLIGEERIGRSIIKGGSSGISCWKSYVSSDTGEMNITVEYEIMIPLPVMGSPSARMEEIFKISSWSGRSNERMGGENSEIVYMTENGIVYHEDYNCSYLRLSLRYVPYENLDTIRNESGGRYHACEKCVVGSAMTGVYITDSGNKYHNSLGCSGLKRTIYAVKRSETGGAGGCSRCSGR